MPTVAEHNRNIHFAGASFPNRRNATQQKLGFGVWEAKSWNLEGWERDAWYFYDVVPEFRTGVSAIADRASRAKIGVFYKENDRLVDVTKDTPCITNIFGIDNNQSNLLKSLAVCLTVGGNAWIVGQKVNGIEKWIAVPDTELTWNGGLFLVRGERLDNSRTYKIWQPHPRWYATSDSNARAVLGYLSQLLRINKYFASQMDSRLIGNGILAIPNEMAVINPIDSEQGKDNLAQEIWNKSSETTDEPESPVSQVPIILQAEAEAIDKIKHITLSTPFDENALELKKSLVNSLALGMNIPPEVIIGSSASNRWTNWQIDETIIKVHIEPMLNLICTSLKEAILDHALRKANFSNEEIAKFVIKADTKALQVGPDRSQASLELYDRGLVSKKTVLEANGFEANAAQTEDEHKQWFTEKVAMGQTTPDLVKDALDTLGITLDEVNSIISSRDSANTTHEARPNRSLKKHPQKHIPTKEKPTND